MVMNMYLNGNSKDFTARRAGYFFKLVGTNVHYDIRDWSRTCTILIDELYLVYIST